MSKAMLEEQAAATATRTMTAAVVHSMRPTATGPSNRRPRSCRATRASGSWRASAAVTGYSVDGGFAEYVKASGRQSAAPLGGGGPPPPTESRFAVFPQAEWVTATIRRALRVPTLRRL